MMRKTIAGPVGIGGMTLHSGVESAVSLKPAEAGDGIVFVRSDRVGEPFVINGKDGVTLVKAKPMCTVIENGDGLTISTIEHLMATFAGLGITDVCVDVDGPELPILDGSALPWVKLIDKAGRVELDAEVEPFVVTENVLHEEKDRRLAVTAASGWELKVAIEFPHPAIGKQALAGVVSEEWFRNEVAPARTFAIERDLKTAQAWGLAKGATLDGGVLFTDDGRVMNAEGLRFSDEPIRHKVLDAMGDLYMAGRPWQAAFDLFQPGHAVSNAFLRKVMETL